MWRLLGSTRRPKLTGPSPSLYQSSVGMEGTLGPPPPEQNPHDSFVDGQVDMTVTKGDLMEEIDELVHQLQYQIDRCRRLLESSGIQLDVNKMDEFWLEAGKKERLLKNVQRLKKMSVHVLTHLAPDPELPENNVITATDLRTIHDHIFDMNGIVTRFHDNVAEVSHRWKKRRAISSIPLPIAGSIIPASLVAPVVIDAMVDGFLIGLSSSISIKVGWILAVANAMEMAFLGLAMSVRIRKCTGSHVILRYLALLGPPLVMLAFTILGAVSGSLAQLHVFFFLVFVAFGVVALLYLSCNELMYEARQSLDGNDPWWSSGTIFLGVFLIIVLDKLCPDANKPS